MPTWIAASEKLAPALEAIARSTNLRMDGAEVDEECDHASWKLVRDDALFVGVTLTSYGRSAVCRIVPVVTVQDEDQLADLYLPYSELDWSDETVGWVTETVASAVSRADALIQVLSEVEETVKTAGFDGVFHGTGAREVAGRLQVGYILAETREGVKFATDLEVYPTVSGMTVTAKTCVLDDDFRRKTTVFHKVVSSTACPDKTLSAIARVVSGLEKWYTEALESARLTPYQRLLKDPASFGTNVVLLAPRRAAR